MRWIPLGGLLAFFALGVVWRSWLHRRRHGSSGIVLFRSGRRAQNAREALVVVLFAVLGIQAAAGAFDPASLDAFRLWPSTPPWSWFGAAALLGAIVLMVVAQLDMGASWRIGIEERARPGLVVGGLYRFSRNPIYLALLLGLFGFVLLQPTWPALAALLAAYVGIRKQVAAEEDHLGRIYGDTYAVYAARVGRFLPALGRLSPPSG